MTNTPSKRGSLDEIQGVAWIRLDDAKLEEFKRLSAQCVEIARTQDTGTLQYEIYISADQSEAIVLERYRDSESLIEHAVNLGELGPAVLATGSATSALIGEPSTTLREMLAGGRVRLFTRFLTM